MCMRFESVLTVARFCCICWNSMLVHLDKRLGLYIDAAVTLCVTRYLKDMVLLRSWAVLECAW